MASTELSDIRLLGRCGGKETRLFSIFCPGFFVALVTTWMQRSKTRLSFSADNLPVDQSSQ